jgi:alkanesulfonate monooxygenase SsuD/methylene tetrahydromethanopterin reductase-like flavin-dependent oxidoreductase (luciferase family)
MTERVGIGAAPFRPEAVEFVRQAERLGIDSVWSPEFWAGDAFKAASATDGTCHRP